MKGKSIINILLFVGLSLICILCSIGITKIFNVTIDAVSYTIGAVTAFSMVVIFAVILILKSRDK